MLPNSIIYYYVTKYTKNYQLKTTISIYYLSHCPWARNLGAASSGHRVSEAVVFWRSKWSWRVWVVSLTWLASSCWLLAGPLSFPSPRFLHQGCLSVLTTWRPTALTVPDSGERDGESKEEVTMSFYDLTMEATLSHFCNILLVTQVSSHPCGNTYGSMTARRQKSPWAPWRWVAALFHELVGMN